MKAAYPVMTEKVDRILIRRYCHILDEKKARYVEEMPRENSFHSIMLGDALARTFRQDQWQDLIDSVSTLTHSQALALSKRARDVTAPARRS